MISDFLQIYAEWQPFQFLAYWFELCQFYQGVYGPFFALDPAHYHKFSGIAGCLLVNATSCMSKVLHALYAHNDRWNGLRRCSAAKGKAANACIELTSGTTGPLLYRKD